MRTAKKCIIIMMCMLTCFDLTGCRDTLYYYDEHPDAYTVLIRSILGVDGSENVGIIQLEQDSYGRTLYAAKTCATIVNEACDQILALLVVQSSDEKTVCYLEGNCYILCSVPNEWKISEETIKERFVQEEIAALKERNNWNLPLTGTMAIRSIQRKNISPYDHSVGRGLVTKHSRFYDSRYENYLDSDAAGRAIYFVREYDKKGTLEEHSRKGFLIFVDSDGIARTIVELTDVMNFQDQLDLFKAENGWEPIVTTQYG